MYAVFFDVATSRGTFNKLSHILSTLTVIYIQKLVVVRLFNKIKKLQFYKQYFTRGRNIEFWLIITSVFLEVPII